MSTADAIVIGAGIAGAAVAAELSASRQVVLVEKEAHAGYHATGRSAAVFVPNYQDAAIRALSRESRAHFDTPDDRFWPTPLLSPRGLLRVARPEGLEAYRKQLADAVGVEPVTMKEAIALSPILRADRFLGASYEEDVHDIDVDALLQGYLRKLRHNGGRMAAGREIVEIARNGRAWRVRSTAEDWSAPLVVNAAGPWADGIATLAGVPPLGLTAGRRSVAVLPVPQTIPESAHMPFTVPFPLDWYAKRDGAALLVSCAEEEEVEPHDAYADDMRIAEGLYRFEQDTTVSVQRLERSWAGLRTLSPDGHPIVGFDPWAEGFFWVAGLGGFGVQTAPAVALLAGKIVTGAESEHCEAFQPSRFA